MNLWDVAELGVAEDAVRTEDRTLTNKNLKVHQNNKYILKNVSQINKFHQYNNESNYIKSFQTLGADNNLIKYNYPVNIEEKKAINDTMEINERDENPELMMSTYRNFGFGEQNYNNIY